MKGIINFIVVMLFGFTTFASQVSGDADRSRLFGPDDTFPWGLEQPIPWEGMQGVWIAQGTKTHYFFDTLGKKGDRYLKVIEFLPGSCRPISGGYAYESERVVTGFLADANDPNSDSRINVHVFAKQDMPKVKTTTAKSRIVVMTRHWLTSPGPGVVTILVKQSKPIKKFCK